MTLWVFGYQCQLTLRFWWSSNVRAFPFSLAYNVLSCWVVPPKELTTCSVIVFQLAVVWKLAVIWKTLLRRPIQTPVSSFLLLGGWDVDINWQLCHSPIYFVLESQCSINHLHNSLWSGSPVVYLIVPVFTVIAALWLLDFRAPLLF